MRAKAIIECRERLLRAEDALAAMRDAKTYSLFRRNWSYFLLAAAGVYAMLHEGSKGCQKSRDWCNLRKKERKNDPMLSYLHHARDSAEHGLGALSPQAYKVEPTPGKTLRVFMERNDLGDCVFYNEDPPYEVVRFPLTI